LNTGATSEDAAAESPPARATVLRLRAGAIMGIAEQTFVGLSSFVIYALVLRRLGAEDLGVWSLALAASTVAGYISYPNPATLYHAVAHAEAEGDRARTVSTIETATLLTTGFFAVMAAIGYLPFHLMVNHSVPESKVALVSQLLPLVFLSIFLSNLSFVYLYTLGAPHRMYLRSALSIFGTFTLLALTYGLFDSLGIVAAAVGVLGRQVILLVGAAFQVKRHLPELRLFAPRFSRKSARGMTGASAAMQAMPMCLILEEPFTRMVLGSLGAMEGVSMFAITWRAVQLPRGFIYSGLQSIAPAFGAMSGGDAADADRLQKRAIEFVFVAMPVVTAATIGASPLIGEIMYGTYQPQLVVYMTIVALGVFFEGIFLSPYMRSVGEGRLKQSLTAHLLTAGLNVVLGACGALAFGETGAIIGLGLAMAIGYTTGFIGNIRLFNGRVTDVLKLVDLSAIAASAAAAAACLVIYAYARAPLGFWATAALMALCAAALVAGPLLRLARLLKRKA
jgi:O-antigen/teichoic acid export membrane protein